MSAGWVSKLWLPSGRDNQGCLLRVQKCTLGRTQEVSSKVPARTFRMAETGTGPAPIHEPHLEQIQRVVMRPLSAWRRTICGSPERRRKAPAGRTKAIEKALLVML